MTKDVIEAILERRSVRKFKDEEVPDATLSRLLDAARWAPSAGNLQPWKIIVVLNEAKRKELVSAALGQKTLAQAPVVFVVCAVPEVSANRYRERGRNLYAIQDTAAMVQNILLAADGYGLGTCWVGAFEENLVSEALNLSKELKPIALIPIGYPDGEFNPPARKSIDEITEIIK